MTMPVQVALVAAKEEQTELRSPLMGRFTAAVAVGTVVQGGTHACPSISSSSYAPTSAVLARTPALARAAVWCPRCGRHRCSK